MNPYEAQRESRIAQNQQRMRDMGIPDAAFAVRQICKKPAKPRTVVPKPVDLAPTRVSKRIRGEKPVYESKALVSGVHVAVVCCCCSLTVSVFWWSRLSACRAHSHQTSA